MTDPDDSVSRAKGTSRVIDELHSTIDTLRQQLESSELEVSKEKKKFTTLKQKSDSLIEQLVNAKHENEVMSGMFKRKERRINDLEEQLTSYASQVDKLNFERNQVNGRMKFLEENEKTSMHEMERLKVSYEALQNSQKEWKSHYFKEISEVKSQLEEFLNTSNSRLDSIASLDNSQTSTELSEIRRKAADVESLYGKKSQSMLDALKSLALAARTHGTETRAVLSQCEDVLRRANKEIPTSPETASSGDDKAVSTSPPPVASSRKRNNQRKRRNKKKEHIRKISDEHT